MCIVFTPAEPKLFNLNVHAWLILELAAGKTHEALTAAYTARVVPPLTEAVARRQLGETLDMLTGSGILRLATEADAST
jgi:hypothetical protein